MCRFRATRKGTLGMRGMRNHIFPTVNGADAKEIHRDW
jgi:hypothetical protein